jgi:hypothetical protein
LNHEDTKSPKEGKVKGRRMSVSAMRVSSPAFFGYFLLFFAFLHALRAFMVCKSLVSRDACTHGQG